jgi:UDP-N-acetylglucosamine:LPS N-acetylglucosamine transferase
LAVLKTILILTAGFGEGHNSAARNLRDALLHESAGGVKVEVLDLYATTYGRVNDLARWLYLGAINRTPRLWRLVYRWLDRPGRFERLLFLQRRAQQTLARTLTELRPAAVCCTYPGYNYLLARLAAAGLAGKFFHATMVTDSISINSIWHRAAGDVFMVPDEATAAVMARQGVPRDKLRVCGFPVPLAFALPARRLTVGAPDDGNRKVLYIVNAGRAVAPALVRRLLAVDGITLTVTAGRDAALGAQLRRLTAGHEARVSVLGWTDRMPQLLMTHHLVITKAGGATTQEAIAAGCPVIFNQLIPGQEEGNWELLRRAGAGCLEVDYRRIPGVVREIFAHDAGRWRELRANLARLSRPDAALRAARYLLSAVDAREI